MRNPNKITKNQTPQNTIITTRTQSISYEGPIPDPHTLQQYDRIQPGMAKEIIDMARDQSRHRQHLEKTVIEGNAKAQDLGLKLAFILAFSLFLGSFILILMDKPILGIATIIIEITALASVFIYNRRKQSQERATKISNIPLTP